jgi:hypothetical protein
MGKHVAQTENQNRKAQQNYRHYFSIFIYFLMMTVRGERDQKVGASGDQKRGKMMRGPLLEFSRVDNHTTQYDASYYSRQVF